MNNLRAALTLTFQDQLSPGLNRLRRGFEQIRDVGRRLNLGGLENAGGSLARSASDASILARALGAVERGANRAADAIRRAAQASKNFAGRAVGQGQRIGAVGAVVGGFGLQQTLQANAGQDDQLRSAAIAGRQRGPDADVFIADLGNRLNNLALKTGQSSRNLAGVAAWMLFNGFSPEQVQSALPGQARIATATGADALDVARVGEAVGFNLKVKPEDIQRAFAILSELGKEGGFQFPDMARIFPGTAAAASRASMSGIGAVEELAAAMNLLLKTVPDTNPAEAGNNLSQFLEKLTSNETSRVFKEEFKVDINAVLLDGLRAGRSRLEAGLEVIRKIQEDVARRNGTTDPLGRRASDDAVVGKLFVDAQARAAAAGLLSNIQELKDLIKVARGVRVEALDEDFATRMGGDKAAVDEFGERLTQASNRLGKAFTPALQKGNQVLDRFGLSAKALDRDFPGLIDNVILGTGAFIALGAALGVLAVVGPAVSAGFGLMFAALAALFTPMGLALGLLAAGAFHVIQNWERFGPFFVDIWEGTKAVFLGVAKWVNSTLVLDHAAARDALIEVWRGGARLLGGALEVWKTLFKDLTTTLDSWTGGGITATFNSIGAAIGAVVDKIAEFLALLDRLKGTYKPQPGDQTFPAPFLPQSLEGPAPTPPAGPGGITTVYIRPEPGTEVTRVEGGGNVSVDPGRVTGRP